MEMPKEYKGREQAFVKHTILSTYIARLFMIIGQREVVINYVDCFAGPWGDESEDLRTTSIGISIAQMESCVEGLQEIFGRQVKFRALYIEKNSKAYSRLLAFVEKYHSPSIELKCKQGDYSELIKEIVEWCDGHFTFFFIDPKGWNQISAKTLSPLLQMGKSEFLINLMYDFANRAASIKNHKNDMIELLGEAPNLEGQDPAERQYTFLTMYRERLKEYHRGWTSYVRIERPGQDRLLYFLVYLTRHPIGIHKFKEEAEKLEKVQRTTHIETKLRKQFEKSSNLDIFNSTEIQISNTDNHSNLYAAKNFLIDALSDGPLLIDNECWARFLEISDFFPSELQKAMKELFDEEIVQNLDENVRKRRTKIIKPDWPNKSERWALVKTNKSNGRQGPN
ncbi:MAG TPA: three-Cys-motif partner protein TcmP [Gammaproteobacteria bacterium]|nr:three-Cys-motif partner protein TcmP [Gammaproteobacteria bacterium]